MDSDDEFYDALDVPSGRNSNRNSMATIVIPEAVEAVPDDPIKEEVVAVKLSELSTEEKVADDKVQELEPEPTVVPPPPEDAPSLSTPPPPPPTSVDADEVEAPTTDSVGVPKDTERADGSPVVDPPLAVTPQQQQQQHAPPSPSPSPPVPLEPSSQEVSAEAPSPSPPPQPPHSAATAPLPPLAPTHASQSQSHSRTQSTESGTSTSRTDVSLPPPLPIAAAAVGVGLVGVGVGVGMGMGMQRPPRPPNSRTNSTSSDFSFTGDDGLLGSLRAAAATATMGVLGDTATATVVVDGSSVSGSATSPVRVSTNASGYLEEDDDYCLRMFPVKNLDTGETLDLLRADRAINPIFEQLTLRASGTGGTDHQHHQHHAQPTGTSSSTQQQQSNGSDSKKPPTKEKKALKFLARIIPSSVSSSSNKGSGTALASAPSSTASTPTAPTVAVTATATASDIEQQHAAGTGTDACAPTTAAAAPSDCRVKVSVHNKALKQLSDVRLVQCVPSAHRGPIWCAKVSHPVHQGSTSTPATHYLATGGQDGYVRVWRFLPDGPCEAEQQQEDVGAAVVGASPTCTSAVVGDGLAGGVVAAGDACVSAMAMQQQRQQVQQRRYLDPVPHRVLLTGREGDVVDLAWSKNHFVVVSTMDKRVRVYHVSREDCLVCFKHADIVTSVCFHPADDKYFLSGSFDERLRVYSLKDRSIARTAETKAMVTAVGFSADGKTALCGTFDGQCLFYKTDTLEYVTKVETTSAKRGKPAAGKKITGIANSPTGDKFILSSNDSRVRQYHHGSDYSVQCRFKGHANASSHIRAAYSHDGRFLVSGSEDGCVHVWNAANTYAPHKGVLGVGPLSSFRRDKNNSYEKFNATGDSCCTVALFAPFLAPPPPSTSSSDQQPLTDTQTQQQTTPRGTVGSPSPSPSPPPPPRHARSKSTDSTDSQSSAKSDSARAGGAAVSMGGEVAASDDARGVVVVAMGFNGEIKVFENRGSPAKL